VTGASIRAVPAKRLKGYQPRLELARRWSARYDVNFSSGYKAADRLTAASVLSIDTADRWCVVLGLHLSEVYPELYLDDVEVA